MVALTIKSVRAFLANVFLIHTDSERQLFDKQKSMIVLYFAGGFGLRGSSIKWISAFIIMKKAIVSRFYICQFERQDVFCGSYMPCLCNS